MLDRELKRILLFCAQWSLFWLSIFSIQYLCLHSNDLKDYYFYPTLSVIYFIGIAIIAGYSYGLHSDKKFLTQYNEAYLAVPVLFVCFLLVSPIIDYSIPLSKELKEYLITTDFHYPFFFNNTTTVKIADITFQQILIFIFFKQMRTLTKNKRRTIFIFTSVFTALHAPLLMAFDWWLSGLFILCSSGAGLIFSYFHMYSRYGLVFSLIVHQAFYVAIGSYLRFLYWV